MSRIVIDGAIGRQSHGHLKLGNTGMFDDPVIEDHRLPQVRNANFVYYDAAHINRTLYVG